MAEAPAAAEESEGMTLPTCTVEKMKGNATAGCKATCRAERKEDKPTVAACGS